LKPLAARVKKEEEGITPRPKPAAGPGRGGVAFDEPDKLTSLVLEATGKGSNRGLSLLAHVAGN
jgi:hypothetical protein